MKTKKNWMMALPLTVICLSACASSEPPAAQNHGTLSLSRCPQSPNCVSSTSSDKRHAVDPLAYGTEKDRAFQTLIDLLSSNKQVRHLTIDPPYVHAEFASPVFGFVDDVDFYFDDQRPVVQVRSASRIGYYDFGANRKRVERLRRQLSEALEGGF